MEQFFDGGLQGVCECCRIVKGYGCAILPEFGAMDPRLRAPDSFCEFALR